MKILISGGGIGGLTAALCFLHHGHDVTVLEAASEFGEVGAGIQVSPNAMKVFEALGLDAALSQIGFQPEAIEARMGKSGMELFTIPLGETAVKRWGASYLHIHRADYVSVLEAALRAQSAGRVRCGVEVIGYAQTGGGVRVQLVGGEEVDGDVLIGADGIHSAIRAQMLGAQKPVFTGTVAWRAVVPVAALGGQAPNPTACVWMGRGRHCVTYRLRRGELANFVGVVERDDWTRESWTERGSREDALADFADWHPTITRILEESRELYRWALFDRAPLERWVDGRAALLGDAAHPMLPFMAQGAAMAVEDAWVVADMLTRHGDVEEGLEAYQRARLKRTARVQAASRANAKTFHRSTRLGQVATYAPMWIAGKAAPKAVHSRQDWLYGHDVTAR